MSADLAALTAEEFPWSGADVYLNSASTGPLPARTRRAIEAFNGRRSTPFVLSDADLFAVFTESRRLVAQLLNVTTGEIALATNTTTGINIAARALPFRAGDVVVVSDREFPANVYPWLALRDRGVIVELAPTTAEGWPDEDYLLARAAAPEVRAVAVSLVQFANGYAVDLAALSAATRATDTFLVVDAIQGIGAMPVDLTRTPVDILACGAQKWLLSPWGSGFTYVRRDLIGTLVPPVTSWMAFEGTDDFSRLTEYDDTYRADARRFEQITLPFQDFVGMNTSVGMLLQIGVARIADHIRALHAPVLEWAARRGVRVASPVTAHRSAILCVAPPDPAAAHQALKAAHIYSSLREGAIRLSPHLFNTSEQMARVVEVLDTTF